MARYGMVVDVEKCTGCHSCFLACKDEYIGNDYLPTSAAQPAKGHTWIRLNEVEQGTGTKIKVDYVPTMCQQCASMPCAAPAPAGAVYRREDGIVIIDPEKAKGCKKIVDACPYRVVYWNEEKELPQKCTMCAHMLDNGEKITRCAEACPTGALVFGDMDDKNSAISKLLADKAVKTEVFKPEFDASPSIQYLHLPKIFLDGEIVFADKKGECAKDVKVVLADQAGKVLMETKTDFFGDFEFKDLAKNANYVIKVDYAGYCAKEVAVRAYASLNIGEIVLESK